MAQFTEFPLLPPGEPKTANRALLNFIRQTPKEGEPFRAFRKRAKRAQLWHRERLAAFYRFLYIAEEDPIRPSAFMQSIIDADDDEAANARIIERLWEINPLLLVEVLRRLKERVHSTNELLKYIDSFAYPGARLTGPHFRAWVQLAQGAELFKLVGIRLGLTELGEAQLRRAEDFELEEFLEEDEDEPLPQPLNPPQAAAQPAPEPGPDPVAQPQPVAVEAPAPVAQPQPAARPAPRAAPVVQAPPASEDPDPLGRGRVIPPRRFLGQARFAPDVLAATRDRLAGWWAELDPEIAAPEPADFDIDGSSWLDDPEETLFRLAVAAALITRVGPAQAPSRYKGLVNSGALDALMQGVAHDGPLDVDPNALLLASVVARRCAEHPDLSSELERAGSSDELFKLLSDALGNGLFGLELFWLLRALGALGLIRTPGLEALTAIPTAEARHALFRLGLLETPYAHDAEALKAASKAARELLPEVQAAGEALTRFARAAGCAYGCPHRRRCDLPCRERGDL